MLLLRLAWRNVLRNKRRTLLSGTAVGICLAALVFVDALWIGMLDSMIRSATDTFMGQGQIHREGFRGNIEVEKTINDSGAVLKSLAREEAVEAFTPRTISFGMISSAANASGIILYGIVPATERRISKLDEALTGGDYGSIEGDGANRILIGSKLAETLEAGLGDRLVVTVAQAHTGELSQEMFRVGGIFNFGIREVDGGMAYINLKKAQGLLGLGDEVHEIALRFGDIDSAGDKSLPLWEKYSTNGNEAAGWKELMPELESVIEMSDFGTFISLALIFGIIVLIVMNTLFMSLYERMFEFGVLRAMGTRPLRMAAIILLEAASLSFISIVIGSAIGLAFTWYYSVHGIDYLGIEFAGVTLRELLYPVLSIRQYTVFPFWMLVFSLIAAIYPAVYAAKLTPAKAMRKSM
jgi:ABC-type lipoprotein release transport system permease subunit